MQGWKLVTIHTGQFPTLRQPRDWPQPGLSSTLLRTRVEISNPGWNSPPVLKTELCLNLARVFMKQVWNDAGLNAGLKNGISNAGWPWAHAGLSSTQVGRRQCESPLVSYVMTGNWSATATDMNMIPKGVRRAWAIQASKIAIHCLASFEVSEKLFKL